MLTLNFPDDIAIGTVAWQRRVAGQGPTMAMGSIDIPDDARVDLRVMSINSVVELEDGRVSFSGSNRPVDLSFFADLPEGSVESVHLGSAVKPGSVRYLPHIAPGLRSLYLAGTRLKDDSLIYVSQLSGLTYLQTFDNEFTDDGVQALATLRRLESLYLEERSLSAAAFRFVSGLPRLMRLRLQDVPLEPDQLAQLQASLPGVDVG